jgi:general secretion pathway protein C
MLPIKWIRQWLINLNFSALLSQTTRYRTGAVLTVITILTFQSVGIFYKALGLTLIRTKTGAPAVQRTVSAPLIAAEPADAFKIIADRNLFGTTDKPLGGKQVESQTTQTDLTSTLEVRGTVAGDAKYGFAVIEDKKLRKQSLYKVGDTISGVKIIRIMRNAVAFMVNNQETILKVPETVEKGGLPTPTVRTAAPVPAAPGGAIVLSRSEITENLKDLGNMLSQAQIRPYFTAGKPDGFMLSNIRGDSIYQKIGLLNGDVVQAVGDRKLSSGDDMVALYNHFKSSSDITLKVMRQGREQTLTYAIR